MIGNTVADAVYELPKLSRPIPCSVTLKQGGNVTLSDMVDSKMPQDSC